MILGRVDDVDGHHVGTKFVLALVPTESVYVAPFSKRATAQPTGMRLKLDARSVLLAYGRVWLPVAAVGLVALGVMTAAVAASVGGVLLGAVSVLAHRAGKLPEEEKQRLRLLGSVTGLRVDPSRLERGLREAKRESLGALMDKAGIPRGSEAILSVLDDIPTPALPLVYGYARYAGDDVTWRACASIVYARCREAE